MMASKLKKICQNRNCLSWRKLNSLNSPEILSWPKATKPTYTSTLSDVPHVLYLMPSMMMYPCTLPDVIYNGLYMYSTWSHLWAPVHVLYLMPSMMTCTCTLHDVLHDVYMYSNWCFPCHVHVLYLMSPMMTCTCSTWWPPWCYVHLRYLMSQGCVHLLYLMSPMMLRTCTLPDVPHDNVYMPGEWVVGIAPDRDVCAEGHFTQFLRVPHFSSHPEHTDMANAKPYDKHVLQFWNKWSWEFFVQHCISR